MTQIDRVAGLYVTGADGQPGVLVASAGRDINLQGALISNASVATQSQASTDAKSATSAAGDSPTVQRSVTALNAGRDLNLTTVTTGLSIQGTSRGRRSSSSMNLQTSEETGTVIQSQGDIGLSAKQDIAIRAGQVQSSQGALGLTAGRDIAIAEGRQTFSLATTNQSSSRSTFKSSSTNQANSNQTNTSVESSLGGQTVVLDAGRDIQIRGANVVSDSGTTLKAINNITIQAATNSSASSSFVETKQSGLMGSGGAGVLNAERWSAVFLKVSTSCQIYDPPHHPAPAKCSRGHLTAGQSLRCKSARRGGLFEARRCLRGR
jgi:filamentous hemagglutinin